MFRRHRSPPSRLEVHICASVTRLRTTLFIATLALSGVAMFAADIQIFGPWVLNGNGRPVLERRTFSVADNQARFILRLTNTGIPTGFVAINGQIVVRPRDFHVQGDDAKPGSPWNPVWDRMRREHEEEERRKKDDKGLDHGDRDDKPKVPLIERTIALRKGRNEIVVGFVGPQGTTVTIEILGKDSQTTDTTPPTITASIFPAPNAAGWNNTPVTVTFACTDAGSGIVTCPPPVAVSADGAGQAISGTAVDAAGNSSSTSAIVNLDQVAPEVSSTREPAANANGWNNGQVTVTFTAADLLSGVVLESVTQPVPLTNDGTNLRVIGRAVDRGGNSGSITSDGINIDQVRPTISVNLSPAPNAHGFVAGTVTATFSCDDVGSGVVTCPPPRSVSLDGLNQSVTGSVTDRAGNSASVTSAPFSIDTKPPVIDVALTPVPNEYGWISSQVLAHFTCFDSGSGVASCPPDQTISTDGMNQTVSGAAFDRAGNTSSITSPPFNIDRTGPEVTVELLPPPNANGWNNGPVFAHFTCVDVGSGVADCPSDQRVEIDGANQTVNGTATDRAGNRATVTSDPFNIDTALPTIEPVVSPAPDAGGINYSDVTVSFSCSDALSGAVDCPPPTVLTTDGPGQTVHGTVSDRAGNTATTNVTVNIDRTPPAIAIASPATATLVNTSIVKVTGAVTARSAVNVSINRVAATVTGTGPYQFSAVVPIVEGDNVLTAEATDTSGRRAEASIGVRRDSVERRGYMVSQWRPT